MAAICDQSSGAPASLQALLASSLPFGIAALGVNGWTPLLTCAAVMTSSCAAKVQLLCQAGAQLTTAELLHAIDGLAAGPMAHLLAAGRPAVDAAQPSQTVRGVTSYSCPMHRALHMLVRTQLACLPCRMQRVQ